MTAQDLKDAGEMLRAGLLGQLVERRGQLGLAQEEVADRAGVSRMTVVRAEAPDADPKLSTFVDVALALNLLPQLQQHGNGRGDEPHPEDIVHRGLAYNRVKGDVDGRDRERERAFAASWESVNRYTRFGVTSLMPALVPQHTQEQATAAATVIQWLGSSVGFDFLERALESVGYKIVDTRGR